MAKRVKVTAWDLIERMKDLVKGTRVKLDGTNEAPTEWIKGEMLEAETTYEVIYDDDGGREEKEDIIKWQMCFVGGLAAAEHLLMAPGTRREDLSNVHNGELDTRQGHDALEACYEVIKEQFPERLCNDKDGDMQYEVINFNDDARTTLNDVYTVLEKAAVVLAEKGK